MKKIISIILCCVLCTCVFAACSAQKANNDIVLKPTEKIDTSNLLPEDNFLGTYKNDDYTAVITKDEDGKFNIVITSKIEKAKGDEWQIKGWFSETTYRVNYKNAVKYNVSYDNTGKETKRAAEYENGLGRIQFDEKGSLKWTNEMEPLSGSDTLSKQ